MPTIVSLLLALVALLSPQSASAELRRVTLDNGLRLVVERQAGAQLAVVGVSYLAGSAHDPPTRRGLAPLLEAAMFMGGPQGSQLAAGDHQRKLQTAGGTATVLRTVDVTSYVDRVPSEAVPLALWLEAQRMLAIGCNPGRLDVERKRLLAMQAQRQRVDAAATAAERLRFMALQAHAAYGRPELADVAAVRCSDVLAAHQAQHGPERAVVTVIADIDPEAVAAQVKRYFAPIPRRSSRPRWRVTMREQTTRRAASIQSKGAHRNVLAYGWPVGGLLDGQRAALEVAAALLGGPASDLYRRLVIDDAKALDVRAQLAGLRGPDVLSVIVALPRDQAPTDAVARVERAALRLVNVGTSEDEVVGARRQLATRRLGELQDHATRAHRLGTYELLSDDAGKLLSHIDSYERVTREDVRRVARRYLLSHRSTAIEGFAAAIPRSVVDEDDDRAKGKKRKKRKKRKKTKKSKRRKKPKAKSKRKPKPKPKKKTRSKSKRRRKKGKR